MKAKLLLRLILTVLLITNTFPAIGRTVDVTIPNMSAESGATIAVPINVTDVSGLNIFSFNIIMTFDQQVLDVTGVTIAGTVSEPWGSPTYSDVDGQISIAGAGASALAGSGVLIYVDFSVLGSAGAQTQISFSQMLFNEGEPAANATGGTFSIAGGSQQVNVTIPNTSANAAESVAIPINVSDVTGLNIFSYNLTLTFDQQVLDATDVTVSGTITESWGSPTFSDGDGQILIAGAGSSALSGSGVLLYINFSVVGSAGGQTTLSFSNFIFNEGDPVANTSAGVFTIEGEDSGWKVQNSGVEDRLYSVSALSEDVAWAAGDNGTILRTANGGDTWTNVGNVPDTLTIYNIEGLDANIAFIAGVTGKWSAGTNVTHIYRTSNGGASWIQVYQQPGGFINDITLFNETDGIAIGGQVNSIYTILKTTNGGFSWEQIANAPMAGEGEHPYYSGVFWLDNTNGWFGVNGYKAYQTTDGGNTWSELPVPPIYRVTSIAFIQDGYGIASDWSGQIVRTTDGGNIWQEITPPEDGFIGYAVAHENMFFVAVDSSIYRSFDKGLSWEKQTNSPNHVRYMSFVTNHAGISGWAVGNNGVILKYSSPGTAIEIKHEKVIPTLYSLNQNYPNPFNPETTIQFSLPKDNRVELNIYNVLGQKIRSLINENYPAGEHAIKWDGRNDLVKIVNSGVYLLEIRAGDFNYVRKMTFMK